MQSRRTLIRRTIALSLATTLTFGPLLALQFRILPNTTATAPERISYLTLLQTPSTPNELTKPHSEERARRAVGSPTAKTAYEPTYQSTASTADTLTSEAADSISAAKAESPVPPELPASAPLKLDLKSIRAANRASKSDARNLAEKSGTYFGDEPSSQSEKLAEAITRTAKEDCLAKNPAGSLLSVFVIAYMAARDKCN